MTLLWGKILTNFQEKVYFTNLSVDFVPGNFIIRFYMHVSTDVLAKKI